MKTDQAADAIRARLKKRHARLFMRDPFNHPAMIAAMDAASALFPNRGKDGAAARERDRAAVAAGEVGAPVERGPSFAEGRLNREKLLMGTAIFGVTEHIAPKDAEYLRDAGFDFLIATAGGAFRDMLLDSCLKNGIAVIGGLEDGGFSGAPDLRKKLKLETPDFSGICRHPAQVGDMGWDEPNTARFEAIDAYARAYHRALPGRFLFNNLFPDGTTKSLLGADSYRAYVDRWADTVEADYISLDHYPFYCSSLFNRFGFRIALNTYDRVGEACRRTGKDFWIYTQTQGNWFAHMYLLVTFEQIKWQVYTALCYGARSVIQVGYVPLWGNDAYAMKDKDGRLTEQYLYAKRINAEVQKLSPALSPYRSLGVLCAEAAAENPAFIGAVGQQRRSSAERGFSGLPEVRRVRSESTALVGFFEDAKGGKALMLVNCRDPFYPDAAQWVTVDLNGAYRVRVWQKGALVADERRGVVRLRLGSCDGAFITLEQ